MFARSIRPIARTGLASVSSRSYSARPAALARPVTVAAAAAIAASSIVVAAYALSPRRLYAEGEREPTSTSIKLETVVPVESVKTDELVDETSSAAPEEAHPAEAAAQTAFNEETGEINWDCPCLGGMATGPCGEDFKAAFSCFVYSEAEPKGMDCVEKFKAMQDCFRQHPDIYGEEIDDDDEPEVPGAPAPESVPAEQGIEEPIAQVVVESAPPSSQ